MRPVREITAEEENFRIEPVNGRIGFIKRNPVEPEPVGTIVLCAFRIVGYDQDCDGSLMARLDNIDFNDPKSETGWCSGHHGLYPESDLVITEDELKELYRKATSEALR